MWLIFEAERVSVFICSHVGGRQELACGDRAWRLSSLKSELSFCCDHSTPISIKALFNMKIPHPSFLCCLLYLRLFFSLCHMTTVV